MTNFTNDRSRFFEREKFLLGTLLVLTTFIPTSDAQASDGAPSRVGDAVLRDYFNELEQFAAYCETEGMEDEAARSRSLVYPTDRERFVVPFLPSSVSLDEPRDEDDEPRRRLRERLNSLRKKYADEMFSIVQNLRANGQGCDVIEGAYATLWINPDHVGARKILGYSLKDGIWRSQWELDQLAKGLVETPEFGWIPESQLGRYRAGERLYRQEWISAKEEEENILTSGSGWLVETEHFSILSRVSLERGVEVGRFLERYYQAWTRLFYRLVATDAQIIARLDSEKPWIPTKRMRVMLFRDRQEYLRETEKRGFKDERSGGMYVSKIKSVLVYESDESSKESLFSTLAHETTHLFFEELTVAGSQGNGRQGSIANYWVVEGVAAFSESFRITDDQTRATIGGYRDVYRIQFALDSLLVDKTYVPLKKFVRMGGSEFKESSDISLLYNQAAALTFFFMQYQNGRYRSAFLTYLNRVYAGADAYFTLEDLTGKSFEELDKEYASFMRGLWPEAK